MTILISVHAHLGLEVVLEYPSNQGGVSLRAIADPGGVAAPEVRLHTTLEQWWALRTALPKAKDYIYAPGETGALIRDHAEADRLALEFYQRHTTAVQPTDEQLLADVTPFNG